VEQSTEISAPVQSRPASVGEHDAREAAFLRLADQHLDAAYRLARAILRHPADAEDATHDAVVQAWRKWPTLRDQISFEPWFDRILVNTCRNRLQRASRQQARDISDEIGLEARDQLGHAHDRDVVGGAVAALPPDHRVVVALRYYRDLPIEEIATQLGIPAGTVQSRLHYALKRLHAALAAGEADGAQR
jgi:RNA polymerase sigma-70 factor (ECF subfamily)